MGNVDKFTQELPGTGGVRYGKKLWEVQSTSAGMIGSIYAGVVIQMPDGEECEIERYLTLDEREDACASLWGFHRQVMGLAREALAARLQEGQAAPAAQKVADVLVAVEHETHMAEAQVPESLEAAPQEPNDE